METRPLSLLLGKRKEKSTIYEDYSIFIFSFFFENFDGIEHGSVCRQIVVYVFRIGISQELSKKLNKAD